MKILHIVPSYMPAYAYGGPITSVHALNKWLVKAGVEVTVYTTNANGKETLQVPLGTEVDVDGVKVFYFPLTWKPWFYSAELRVRLRDTVAHFDLVHITSVFLSASTLGAYYARKFKKPYIISPRGSLMREPLAGKRSFLKWFYIRFIEARNLQHAIIHFTADVERDEFAFDAQSSFIIPNGIDTQPLNVPTAKGTFRNAFHIDADRRVVLSLGRISWKKGFDTLIPAFQKVHEADSKALLVIAGGDEEGYRKTVEESVQTHGLQNAVLFTGEILGDMKLAAFRESDVFVLPSYSENFGMAVAEAMYCELPVVITKGVGIAPTIVRGNAGIVIDKDETQLANALLQILRDSSTAKEMGKRGREIVRNEFSSEGVAKAMREEYTKRIKK